MGGVWGFLGMQDGAGDGRGMEEEEVEEEG